MENFFTFEQVVVFVVSVAHLAAGDPYCFENEDSDEENAETLKIKLREDQELV